MALSNKKWKKLVLVDGKLDRRRYETAICGATVCGPVTCGSIARSIISASTATSCPNLPSEHTQRNCPSPWTSTPTWKNGRGFSTGGFHHRRRSSCHRIPFRAALVCRGPHGRSGEVRNLESSITAPGRRVGSSSKSASVSFWKDYRIDARAMLEFG